MKTKILFILLIVLFLIPISVYAQQRDYYVPKESYILKEYNSISECQKIQPYEFIGNCYGFFADKLNDINYCYESLEKFEGDKDYTVAECITSFSARQNDVSYCNEIVSEQLRQKCIAKYSIMVRDKAVCNTVENEFWKEECNNEISSFSKYKNNIKLFYYLLIPIVVIIIALLLLKIGLINFLSVLPFVLFPIISFGRYTFLPIRISYLAGGDASQHSLIFLLYGIFCLIMVFLNLRNSFNKWKNNDDKSFRKRIKLSYLLAILYAYTIGVTSTVIYGIFNWWVLVYPSVMFIGTILLVPVGVFLIIYNYKINSIRKLPESIFVFNIIFSLISIIIGLLPFIITIVFWVSGMPNLGPQ